jgi:SAM-dependent methyltransferase
MGDANQLDFLTENIKIAKGPVLEIGSRITPGVNDYRVLFPDTMFVGVDQETGDGVDVVCDFTTNFDAIKTKIPFEKAGTVICFSVLEHCKYPFKMAENITRILVKGGIVFLSVPFVWNIHNYPDDYWRFTPSSIPLMFPECELVEGKSFYSTKNKGERLPLDTDLAHAAIRDGLTGAAYRQTPSRFNSIIKRIAGRPDRHKDAVKKHPYVLFPVMINTVLRKKTE